SLPFQPVPGSHSRFSPWDLPPRIFPRRATGIIREFRQEATSSVDLPKGSFAPASRRLWDTAMRGSEMAPIRLSIPPHASVHVELPVPSRRHSGGGGRAKAFQSRQETPDTYGKRLPAFTDSDHQPPVPPMAKPAATLPGDHRPI